MPGRGQVDALFIVSQLGKKRHLYLVSVVLEKAFHRMKGEVVQCATRELGSCTSDY